MKAQPGAAPAPAPERHRAASGKSMDIVYVSNENYAQHLAVSLCSLFDSNADEEALGAWVLSTGITEPTKEKLSRTAAAFGRELHILELGDLASRFGGTLDTGRFDVSTMGRLFAGDLLPETVERVIYLDCDTVVLKPLSKLWKMDLHGAVLGAAQEPTIYREVKEYLGLRPEEPYFNAGVLVMDLKAWRAEGLRDKVLSYYGSIARVSLFNDQDALNGCLKGRIRTFSPVYNFFTNYRYFRYGTLTAMQASYRTVPERVFRYAKRRPAVIHFAGDERPWKRGSLNVYGKAYTEYLRMTPFRDAPKEKGQELYLLLYHGMDLVTFFFPAVRATVSRRYVEKSIRERAERQKAAEEKQ